MEDNKLRDMEPDERQRAIESLLLDGSNHPWIGDEFFPTFRKMMEIAWYYWTIEEGDSEAMNINLTPEQEKIVQHQMKAGHFRSVEEVIGEALQVLQERQKSAPVTSSDAQRAAVREMLAFVETSRVRLEGVSVKELIDEGHRL